MNFEEAGAALRQEREKRNISLEEVANQLKISPRQLKALEEGDVDSLPHPAYAKGFIRSYAGWLGLNPSDLRQRKPNDQEDNIENASLEMPVKKSSSSHGCLWLLIILACLAGGCYYAWQQNFWGLLKEKEGGEIAVSENLPTANDYLAKKDAENAESVKPAEVERKAEPKPEATAESAPAQPSSSAPALQNALKPDQETENRKQIPETVEATAQSAPANPQAKNEAAPETAQTPRENHKLIITAIEECWVHSNSDKTDTRQFSLRKGDTFALTFIDSLELKLGNAGGVRLRYDGNDMPPAGTSGQVKTIVFPPRENND